MVAESIASTLATEAAGKLASKVIENASPRIFGAIAKRLNREALKLKVQFTKTFQSQLENSFNRSLNVKTIISRDEPVNLEDVYVPLTLSCNNKEKLPDSSADPSLKPGCRYVLSGTGGAGKTVLMKHLLNISSSNRLQLVPLFIELRNLRFDEGNDLEECIHKELQLDGAQESINLFKIALEEGIFILYLDGFDEIHPGETPKALDYIRRFSTKYDKISILITTRPKTGVATLRDFTVFHVEPLTKKSSIDLIKKTKFDEVTKTKFIEKMESGLYDQHETLMSLPILVAMMLLAFRTYADIPDRMTVFYGQAFETLYSIHDSETKELFKRVHHAGLAPDIFKSALQAFCYLSLSNHDIEFTEDTLETYVSRALKLSRIDVTSDKYRNDLIHNVCIIQPDGLSYVFVHRSFQEYFASIFALNYSGEKSFEVIDKIVNVSGSVAAKMMLELDPIKFKRAWLLPKLVNFKSYLESVSRRRIENRWKAFYSIVWHNKTRNLPEIYFSLGNESNINYKTMEILSELTKGNIDFGVMATGLTIPKESDLKKLCKPLRYAREKDGTESGFVFGQDRFYPFSQEIRDAMNNSNFQEKMTQLKINLSKIIFELDKELTDYKAIEIDELLS